MVTHRVLVESCGELNFSRFILTLILYALLQNNNERRFGAFRE